MRPASRPTEMEELEGAAWEASLASCYREALAGTPSRVLERCIDRLERGPVEAWEEELIIVEALPSRGRLLGRRALAWAIDAAVLVGLSFAASGHAIPLGAQLAFGGIAAFAYLTLSGFLGGRSLGDRLAGIRTVGASTDERLSLGRAALRSLLAMLGLLSVVGLFWALIDGSGQALHDRILGTRTLPVDQP